ncbi:cell division ATP-binding protein FtsE [Prochlorothrix hollandica]|uniref:Cell division ATP-binding protein FtsE n=1 Tax=Prochlorothrix hollandica PCC 9006 = CALU 1027 TaxID=317619 RepID=A0A0M2PUV2_PROHO|nr:cell division ATP-binding protein [Prochlorothrix hollandica PCC 9006 = CALU 1027]
MIRLDNVSKTYDHTSQGLQNITWSLDPGAFVFVTGTSGSGKTTLLKLLYGAERPTSGSLWVNGYAVASLRGDPLARFRRQLGVIFQDYKLIPNRTVAENVAFVLWAQGHDRKAVDRRLVPTLKLVGLQQKADCFPDQLSGGEQQRVSIARAIVSTPPLLLADEPTGNLDTENSLQIMEILHKLRDVGITIVITTHDEQLVNRFNHPVLQVHQGRLQTLRP